MGPFYRLGNRSFSFSTNGSEISTDLYNRHRKNQCLLQALQERNFDMSEHTASRKNIRLGFTIREAKASDSTQLSELSMLLTQQSKLSVLFDRSPNFFDHTYICTPEPYVVVAQEKESNRIVAAGSVGYRAVFLNGHVEKTRYLSDLKVHPDYQNGTLAARIFKAGLKESTEQDIAQTVILKDNKKSVEVTTSNRATLPNYFPYDVICSYFLPTFAISFNNQYSVRHATESDIEEMQLLYDSEASLKQFSPYYDFSKLTKTPEDPYYKGIHLRDYLLMFDRDKKLVAMCGLWDQSSFRKFKIVGLPTLLNKLMTFRKNASRNAEHTQKPTNSFTLKFLYVHSLAIKNNDGNLLKILLQKSRNHARRLGFKFISIGLSKSDPARSGIEGQTSIMVESLHYLVTKDGRDPREELNAYPLYAEPSRL